MGKERKPLPIGKFRLIYGILMQERLMEGQRKPTLSSDILNKVENEIYGCYQKVLDQYGHFTGKQIIKLYTGKKEKHKMLLEIFQEHNDKVNRIVGQDFAAGTAERYRTAKMHVKNYIKKEYKANDIPVTEVDHKFISGFEYYLKTERKCAHNSVTKYISKFKKIIRIAFANEWIKRDPFSSWKGT